MLAQNTSLVQFYIVSKDLVNFIYLEHDINEAKVMGSEISVDQLVLSCGHFLQP